MALPVVLLKAKSAISKGAKAVKTAKAVKSVTSNSNEEGVKSFLGVLKTPLIIVISIAGPLAAFVFVVFFGIFSNCFLSLLLNYFVFIFFLFFFVKL